MSARPEERRTAHEYDRWLAGGSLSSQVMRTLLGPAGLYAINTPWSDIPERLELGPHHRVLDLGCGRGALLGALAGRVNWNRAPVGIDVSNVALSLAARDRGEDSAVELAAAAASVLPFRADSFDLVLAAYLFKYLEDDTLFRVLLEVLRVLRPNGVLLTWEFAPTSSRLLNRFHQRLLTLGPSEVHLRGFGLLAPYALSAGFAQVERLQFRTPFLFPPIPRVVVAFQKGPAAPEG